MHLRGSEEYEALRTEAVWNAIVPDRFPAAIVRPGGADEVAEAVREAISRGARVAVKSGGHNWLGTCLRDDAILLDMGGLDDVDVDSGGLVARVGPGATHQKLADAIVPHGLGFPIGHCPTVGLGGYLLAGGYGWNPRTWGPACWSVQAAEVVTMDGAMITIDAERERDLYWAARGGGAAFPGVVTRFHLRLHPLPRIASVRSSYELHRLGELHQWSASLETMPAGTEIALIAHRPIGPAGRLDPVATVQTTGFGAGAADASALAASAAAGAHALGGLVDERQIDDVALNDLETEAAWVKGKRYAVDMCWVAGGYHHVGAVLERALRAAPSPLSRVVSAWGLFPHGGPDVAQSANGTLTINLYAIWDDPAEDAPNIDWVRATMSELAPWITGFYAGESDLAVSGDRPRRCYPPDKWRRLTEIRTARDPHGRKHGYLAEP